MVGDFMPLLVFGAGMCCCVCPLFLGVVVMWCGEGENCSRHSYAAMEVFEDAEKDFSHSPSEYSPRTFTMDPIPTSSAAATSSCRELSHRPCQPRRLSVEGTSAPPDSNPSQREMGLEGHYSPKTSKVVLCPKNFMHLLRGRKEREEIKQIPSPGRNLSSSINPSPPSPAVSNIFSKTSWKVEEMEVGLAEKGGPVGPTRLAMELREGKGGSWFRKGIERRDEEEGRAVEMENVD